MGKGHQDNAKARKKIGKTAYAKKQKRRKKSYIGPWEVLFSCGANQYFPLARSNEIRGVAIRAHSCRDKKCKPIHFKRLL